jgi:hypothetical protein
VGGEGRGVHRLGEFDLDQIVERLRFFARDYGAGGRPHRYVLARDALINEKYVLANASVMMAIIAEHGRLVTVELPFSAATILARNNVRVMGLGKRGELTVRLQVRTSKASLARERRSRRVIERIRKVRSPEANPIVIPQVLASGDGWLVEQQLAGRHLRSTDLPSFIKALPTFYGPTARMRPYRGPFPFSVVVDEVLACVPGISREAFAGELPAALCHGDLGTSNILALADGRFALVDWESGAVMSLALDLAKLCVSYPEILEQTLMLIRRFTADGGIGAEAQLLLALAREAIQAKRSLNTEQWQQDRRNQSRALLHIVGNRLLRSRLPG